jgi:cyanophycinase
MQVPKGFLVSIGGAEDKGDRPREQSNGQLDFLHTGILSEVANLLQSQKGRIEIITTATSNPAESFANYKKAFTKLGCSYVGHMDIADRAHANSDEYVSRLNKCDGVMFSGGDQAKISAVLGGSELCRAIRHKYLTEPFVIAGTSAGAAAMSTVMMNGGTEEKAYLKGEVELSVGFGFISDVIFDTHFDARGRFQRLAQAIALQPAILGVGLGEDTGVVVKKGNVLRCIGSGCVTIIDGREIEHNNIAYIDEGCPISVGCFQVYFLANSDQFDIEARRLTPMKFENHQA